jgi:hypothetical protein
MQLTQEALEQRLRAHLDAAKEELQAAPPDAQWSGLMPRAVLILPDGTEESTGLPWRDAEQKRALARAASMAASILLAQALLLRVVVTQLNAERVAEEIGGLPARTDLSAGEIRAYEKRVLEWVHEHTADGTDNFAELPAEFCSESIMVLGIGPGLRDAMVVQPFEWRAGKPEWLNFPGTAEVQRQVALQLVPKWWD